MRATLSTSGGPTSRSILKIFGEYGNPHLPVARLREKLTNNWAEQLHCSLGPLCERHLTVLVTRTCVRVCASSGNPTCATARDTHVRDVRIMRTSLRGALWGAFGAPSLRRVLSCAQSSAAARPRRQRSLRSHPIDATRLAVQGGHTALHVPASQACLTIRNTLRTPPPTFCYFF